MSWRILSLGRMILTGQLIATWSFSLKAFAKGDSLSRKPLPKGKRRNRQGRLFFDSYNPCIFRLECGSILPTEVTKKKNLLDRSGAKRDPPPRRLHRRERDEPIIYRRLVSLRNSPSMMRREKTSSLFTFGDTLWLRQSLHLRLSPSVMGRDESHSRLLTFRGHPP